MNLDNYNWPEVAPETNAAFRAYPQFSNDAFGYRLVRIDHAWKLEQDRDKARNGGAEWCRIANEALKEVEALKAQSATQLQELERAKRANEILIGALQEIKRTQPQTVMNGRAKMSDPDHIKGGWNFHFMAREAIEAALARPAHPSEQAQGGET